MAFNPYQYQYPFQQFQQPISQQINPQINPQMNSQMNQQMSQPQMQNGGFISVPTEEEAMRWAVAPGNFMTFKVQGKPIVIEKSMGFSQLEEPKIERYRLVKEEAVVEEPKETKETTSDLEAMKADIEDLKREVEDLKAKARARAPRKKEDPKEEVNE